MSKLTNKSAVKAYTLQTLLELRPHLVEKFTRISGQYYEDINRAVAEKIVEKITNLSSVGKTIK